jgi:hypothetical protein
MVKTFDMKVYRRNKQPDWAREVEKIILEVGGEKWAITISTTDDKSVVLGLVKDEK